MNDPHVVALRYRVRHHDSVDYGRAEKLTQDTPDFVVEIKHQKARFELKQHYATEEEAREVVEPFIQDWEFDASLSRDPGCFELEFEGAEIIDRQPTPGIAYGMARPAKFKISIPPTKGTVYAREYPPPPSGIDSSHVDVAGLFRRYERYKAGKEPLTSFAYYCCTAIEQRGGGPDAAAKRYKVSKKLFRLIRRLSSTKGGTEARKPEGAAAPLTQEDRRFLEHGVVRLIRRMAEYYGSPKCLSQINVSDIG